MGLDQYAYARPPRKRNSDNDIQVAEWRKHNRLQGWMEHLWQSKGWSANYLQCKGINHFNAPLELCKPSSQMTQELLTMID